MDSDKRAPAKGLLCEEVTRIEREAGDDWHKAWGKIASGDASAIGPLYDSWGASIYHYTLTLTQSESDAEDVVQNTFERLIRFRHRLGRVSDPRSYVFRVARNEAMRFLRRRQRLRTVIKAAEAAFDVPEAHAARIALLALRDALELLPGKQREVIILKTYEGLTFREIGKVLRISRHTAASRYRYGLEKLRTLLLSK